MDEEWARMQQYWSWNQNHEYPGYEMEEDDYDYDGEDYQDENYDMSVFQGM